MNYFAKLVAPFILAGFALVFSQNVFSTNDKNNHEKSNQQRKIIINKISNQLKTDSLKLQTPNRALIQSGTNSVLNGDGLSEKMVEPAFSFFSHSFPFAEEEIEKKEELKENKANVESVQFQQNRSFIPIEVLEIIRNYVHQPYNIPCFKEINDLWKSMQLEKMVKVKNFLYENGISTAEELNAIIQKVDMSPVLTWNLQEKRKFANDVYNILSFYVHGDKIDQCGALILAFLPEISPPPPLFTQEEFEQISNSCITEAFNVSLPIMSIHTSILHNLDFEINSIKNIYEFFNVIADEKKLPIIKKIKFCNNIEKTEMSIHLLNKFFSRLDEIYFNDVRNLELNSINISPHVCNTLNKNLLCLKNLKILDLGNNHLGSERMMRLIGKIVDIPTLVVLNLENNEIGDLAINKLASNFHCLKKLKTLILNHNNISSVGFKKISQNLSFLNQLTAIDLSYNCAKNEGLMFLSHSFFHLLNLKSLKISHNCSGNKGLTLIIDKIHLLKNLMELDISGNNSGPEPIDMLLKKVRLLTNLTYVDFNGNLVRIETEKEIKDFLEARKDLFKYLKNNK